MSEKKHILAEINTKIMIIEWWEGLTLLMKIVWALTIAATSVFAIQTTLTFLGADTDMDDFSMPDGLDGGMNLYTFRNLVHFILGFGWSFICFEKYIESRLVLFTLALFLGLFLVFIVMMLFKWVYSMQQSGNIDVSRQAAGCIGKVYIPIPPSGEGTGKVQITISNSIREYEAVTNGEYLPTGTPIRVIEVLGDDILLIEKKSL